MKHQTLLATALLLAAAFGAQAQAATEEAPSRILRFYSMDLDRPGGVSKLYSQLTFAAAEVCIDYAGRELARQRAYQKCMNEALATSVARIRHPGLTAWHQRKVGAPVGGHSLARANVR